MKEFNKIMKKIGEELGIKVTLLSDDWTTVLEKDNKIRYIEGYKFDLNKHAIGNILDDKGLFYDLLTYKKIPVISQYVIFNDYDKNDILDYFKTHNNEIIINDISYKICSYRVHKDYDMVTLENINDINKIPFSKNTLVYIDKDKYINKNEYLDSDLIGFIVYNSKIEKEVLDIVYLNGHKKLLKVMDGYIPFELIRDVNLDSRRILIEEVDGL